MKDRTHCLPSFSTWLNKGFDLRLHAGQMSDSRTDPEISPASVFLALFHAFVFRLPSFQQLDAELAHTYLQHWIGHSAAGCALRPDPRLATDAKDRLACRRHCGAGRP